jgi:integrase
MQGSAGLWHVVARPVRRYGDGSVARRAMKRREQGSGSVRQLPSGRWQARYRDGDGVLRPARTADGKPLTFDTKLDASAWLDGDTPREVEVERVDPPLRDYAATWLQGRDLKPRTRSEYGRLLDAHILPALGDVRLSRLTTARIRAWHAALDPKTPTRRAHAYSLLKAILTTAVEDDILTGNPCKIRSAGQVKRKHEVRPATLPELTAIVATMPPRYRAMVLLAAWGGFRFGELTELRRRDVAGQVVEVARGVVRVDGTFIVGDPKSQAGRRRVTVPAQVAAVLEQHLAAHVQQDPEALLFPAQHGGHMAPSTLYRVWYPARVAAGRPDLRFHDLRHTGATLAAASGATIKELMHRLGHSTPAMAMRYQHAAEDRDRLIADALDGFAASGTVGLVARAST